MDVINRAVVLKLYISPICFLSKMDSVVTITKNMEKIVLIEYSNPSAKRRHWRYF